MLAIGFEPIPSITGVDFKSTVSTFSPSEILKLPRDGIEPSTFGFSDQRSKPTELSNNNNNIYNIYIFFFK